MLFTRSSRQNLAGQNDVQLSRHIPMVYERVRVSPLLWEYRVVSVDTREEGLLDETRLNELGSQGWLLANVLEQRLSESGARIHYHFVRPKEA
jgi:hypothetical protein